MESPARASKIESPRRSFPIPFGADSRSVMKILLAALLVLLGIEFQHSRSDLGAGNAVSDRPTSLRKVPIWMRVGQRDRLKGRHKNARSWPPAGQRRILVTGIAGFIASHTAIRFRQRGDVVVGLDNFNNYYDVELKRYRAAIVEKAGATVRVGDLCDKAFLARLFEEFHFSHVIHLAAQAGVRYSIKNPGAYVTANVMCTVSLLEAIRTQKETPMYVYASSSSVYGHSGTPPFAEDNIVDQAASVYAVTKYTTENLAYTYHHLYDIYSTGLRFFTVYGPMGRPDMALWLWTEAVLQGKPIKLYKQPGGASLQRDFTYIADIVDGIEGALKLGAPFETFNLGRGMPLPISAMVRLVETEVGVKADIRETKMPLSEVAVTNCDIAHAHERFGYSPTRTLEGGVVAFVKWYLEYQNHTRALKDLTGEKGVKVYNVNDTAFPY